MTFKFQCLHNFIGIQLSSLSMSNCLWLCPCCKSRLERLKQKLSHPPNLNIYFQALFGKRLWTPSLGLLWRGQRDNILSDLEYWRMGAGRESGAHVTQPHSRQGPISHGSQGGTFRLWLSSRPVATCSELPGDFDSGRSRNPTQWSSARGRERINNRKGESEYERGPWSCPGLRPSPQLSGENQHLLKAEMKGTQAEKLQGPGWRGEWVLQAQNETGLESHLSWRKPGVRPWEKPNPTSPQLLTPD